MALNESGWSNQTIPQDELKWQILNISDDGVDLISSTPTSTRFVLQEDAGYNNGVTLLNSICEEQYSNLRMGIRARNLNMLDIEKLINDEGKNERDQYISDETKYGQIRSYTTKGDCPILYEQEKGSGINSTTVNNTGLGLSDNSELITEGGVAMILNNGLSATQTYYSLNSREKEFFDETVYNMLFNTDNYWLSSRSVNTKIDNISFIMRNVFNGKLSRRNYDGIWQAICNSIKWKNLP